RRGRRRPERAAARLGARVRRMDRERPRRLRDGAPARMAERGAACAPRPPDERASRSALRRSRRGEHLRSCSRLPGARLRARHHLTPLRAVRYDGYFEGFSPCLRQSDELLQEPTRAIVSMMLPQLSFWIAFKQSSRFLASTPFGHSEGLRSSFSFTES